MKTLAPPPKSKPSEANLDQQLQVYYRWIGPTLIALPWGVALFSAPLLRNLGLVSWLRWPMAFGLGVLITTLMIALAVALASERQRAEQMVLRAV